MTCLSFFVGIAGGSGSGKTCLTQELVRLLGRDRAVCLETDAYYRDLSHLSYQERGRVNFDAPEALETTLLLAHLRALARGETVMAPVYDFSTHTRTGKTQEIRPLPFVLVEGVLVLALEGVADLLDFSLFLDVPADIRLIRRLKRDMALRGRNLDQVLAQYLAQVRPMHEQFVTPSMARAHWVVGPEIQAREIADLLETQRGLGRH